METICTIERKAKEAEEKRNSEKKRVNAIISLMSKYQTAIKDIQDILNDHEIKLTCEASGQYERMIKDYIRLAIGLNQDLKNISSRGLPIPPQSNYATRC